MSLFHIFNRPKVDRSRVHAEHDLQSSDYKTSRLDDPPSLAVQDALRPRTPALPKQSSVTSHQNIHTLPPAEDFDLLHPPQFKQIFHLSVRIAPAHTCLVSKANAAAKSTSPSVPPEGHDVDPLVSKRASRIPPSNGTPELLRKIFALTRNGCILQYADRGATDRLPERVQRLTTDTVAIASDLVPGQPYTILIAESGTLEDLTRPDQSSIFSKLGRKHGGSKRSIPSTLIVLDSPSHLEEWLFTVRKEIQLLSKTTDSSPPLQRYVTSPDTRGHPNYGQQSPSLPVNVNHDTLAPLTYERNNNVRIPISRSQTAKLDHTSQSSRGRHPSSPHESSPEPQERARAGGVRNDFYSRSSVGQGTATSEALSSPLNLSPISSKSRKVTGIRTPGIESSAYNYRNSPLLEDSGLPTRKDSLTNDMSKMGFEGREASHAARIRKRASHHGPVKTVERPALRSVSSLGRLRKSPALAHELEPMPALMLGQPYGDSDPSVSNESNREVTRLENDEYHAFQHSLSTELDGENEDEYHRFQQSLSLDANQAKRPSTGKRRRYSTRASPSSQQTSFGEVLPPSSRSLHEAKHRPKTPESFRRPPSMASVATTVSRPPFNIRGAIPIALEQNIHVPAPHGRSQYPESSKSRRLYRPTSMEVRPSEIARPDPHVRLHAPAPTLHTSRSEHTLKDRARVPPPLHLAPHAYDESDDDDEGDMILIQTNVEHDMPQQWPRPPFPSPNRLPVPDLGIPVVALSPPPPPPDTPLPRPPTMGAAWGR